MRGHIMKKVTKVLATVGALALSIGVYAHGGFGNGEGGFHHGMMGQDSEQYQTMLKLHNDPKAMQEWAEKMHDDPGAMYKWMREMHAGFFKNGQGKKFDCPMWDDDDDAGTDEK